MIRKAFHHISRPLSRLLLRTVNIEDAWRRYPKEVPLQLYGAGAQHDFSWYFERPSGVEVSNVEDVLAWLLECIYMRDPDLFNETDFWQHPTTFEELRKGDCEDFALWAWRKLVELGFDAEFVAGRCVGCEQHGAGHTWVHYRKEKKVFLFDPVLRDPALMIQPLTSVRHSYLPEVSVDGRLNRYVYGGYYQLLRNEMQVLPAAM